MFDRIGLGTANWGKKYRGHKVSLDEVKRILEYCQSSGISFIDSATAYENEEAMELVNSYFHVQCKTLKEQRPEWASALISHNEKQIGFGVSAYAPKAFYNCIVQIPYSILDRRWSHILYYCNPESEQYQARSIFCGGKAFTYRPLVEYCSKIGLPVGTVCIDFCLRNPAIDKVIVGVDSLEQLKENLRYFHRIESMECHDLNVIDTRRHKDVKEDDKENNS